MKRKKLSVYTTKALMLALATLTIEWAKSANSEIVTWTESGMGKEIHFIGQGGTNFPVYGEATTHLASPKVTPGHSKPPSNSNTPHTILSPTPLRRNSAPTAIISNDDQAKIGFDTSKVTAKVLAILTSADSKNSEKTPTASPTKDLQDAFNFKKETLD